VGSYNKLESVLEVPLEAAICTTCQETPGKVGDESCPVCEGSGKSKQERSVKLRGRIRNIVKCEFEDWLEYQARRRLFVMKDKLTPAEYDESFDKLQEGIASYTFAWNGKAFVSALSQLPGQVQLLMLLAKDADRLTGKPQDVTEVDLAKALRDDHPSSRMLVAAIRTAMDSSPNFLAPPIRGTAVDD